MLKAKLGSVRKNKKGFSLVELIIVIAIMVALIAVMAPAFVKYVQKSRDAALSTAAEDLQTAINTYCGDPDTDVSKILGTEEIVVSVGADKKLNINWGTTQDDVKADIIALSGADTGKSMGSTTKQFTINITKDGTNIKVTMRDTPPANP